MGGSPVVCAYCEFIGQSPESAGVYGFLYRGVYWSGGLYHFQLEQATAVVALMATSKR
jgi:hypothetical protein